MYALAHRQEKQRNAVQRYRAVHAARLTAEREALLARPHEELKAYWRERRKRQRVEDRDGERRRDEKYRRALRARAFAVLGGQCARCGLTDADVLQIDHVVAIGDTQRRRERQVGGNLYRAVLREPRRFQLLCANHNWKKRHEQGEHRKAVA